MTTLYDDHEIVTEALIELATDTIIDCNIHNQQQRNFNDIIQNKLKDPEYKHYGIVDFSVFWWLPQSATKTDELIQLKNRYEIQQLKNIKLEIQQEINNLNSDITLVKNPITKNTIEGKIESLEHDLYDLDYNITIRKRKPH